jgi:hypothetical protein
MSREDPQMKIRLPVELKARVEDASSKNNRTMNAEIVDRLESTFAEKPGVSAETFVRELAFVRHAYERQIKALEFSQELLAHFLIATTDFLPNEVVTAKQFEAALALARGVQKKDADELVAAYAGLFPELEGEPVLEELSKMSEEHKRGEDVTHYMRQHLIDTRAKWEKKHEVVVHEPEMPIADGMSGKAAARSPNAKKPKT